MHDIRYRLLNPLSIASIPGEVKVVLHNHSRDALTIVSGQRVAQLVCEVFVDADVVEDSSIGERVTERGSKGFGSTDDSAK